MSAEESFNTNILPDISPFAVEWSATTTRKHTSKAGGVYDTYALSILGKGLRGAIVVEVFKTDYDRLRVLNLTGIKSFNATWGLAKKEGARAPMIFSGATA